MANLALMVGARMLDTAAFAWRAPLFARFRGGAAAVLGVLLALSLSRYSPTDPSFNTAASGRIANLLGSGGAKIADLALKGLGLGAWICSGYLVVLGLQRALSQDPDRSRLAIRLKALAALGTVLAFTGALNALAPPRAWPLAEGLGGVAGDLILSAVTSFLRFLGAPYASLIAALGLILAGLCAFAASAGVRFTDVRLAAGWIMTLKSPPTAPSAPSKAVRRRRAQRSVAPLRLENDDEPAAWSSASLSPSPFSESRPVDTAEEPGDGGPEEDEDPLAFIEPRVLEARARPPRTSDRERRENQGAFEFVRSAGFRLPELSALAKPKARAAAHDEAALRQNARLLESVLAEFGVKGVIDQIRPGPVVTLYELAPAAGVKHARVVALSDDIARSMSARACRVSVVQGRNAIGIELPNARRETVYLRDLLSSAEYDKTNHALPLALGETIGGDPYVADLARMPHLLIAGTTGSGKSVGVNAMILSILYRLEPDQCRFIMIDPKMLELSVYDGIPHLLAPVVTDPKKAVVALKWTVREMEDRYRRMSKIGVRNIASYNERAAEALQRGEHFERTVQTGFDETGRPVYESEKIRPEPMPYLVVVMDEMADLMLVAGKDVEGAVQRLAQMARAAGIHLIMATQRPSVDVITGTIKANFPTRISFQVTSKIDSRTILGEQGGEQLLGQGDMLYMAGGGRVTRLHGPFVSDEEVEAVAAFLRDQGEPQYLEAVTASLDEEALEDDGVYGAGSGDDLYDRAVAVVTRDRKASTSYVQRRLQIGYNRAASLIERMEQEGVVSPANHAGKRDILAGAPPAVAGG